MPKPIIKGTLVPQRKSVKIRHDPQNGTTTTQEFESAGNNCGGLANAFAASGSSYDLVSNPVRSSLVVTDTRNIFKDEDEVLERWELYSNQTQLDIKEHPAWSAISIDIRTAILKDVERYQQGKALVGGGGLGPWGTPGDLSTEDHFFQLMIRGVTHYQKPQWVIRFTANVGDARLAFPEADGGVDEIYTTAQLNVPEGRLRSVIQSITAPAANSYLTYGWLKVSHSEVTGARSRVDVSEELWLGQWPIILHT